VSPQYDPKQLERTSIAWRLAPGTRKQLEVRFPWLLTAPGPLALAALAADTPASAAICLGGAAASLLGAFGMVERPIVPEPMTESYAEIVAMLQSSANELEREHIFLGWLAGTERRRPYLLHRFLADHNIHVMGFTGSAKTAKVVSSVLCQVLMMGRTSAYNVDFKGSSPERGNANHWIPTMVALAMGMDVRWYSINKEEAGHIVKMLNSESFLDLPTQQQARGLAEAHNINHGDDGSLAYFSAVGTTALERALEIFRDENRVPSYKRLAEFLSKKSAAKRLGMLPRDFINASNVPHSMRSMAPYPHLNTTGDEQLPQSMFDAAISVDLPIRRPTLINLKLAAAIDATTGRNLVRALINLTHQRLKTWRGERVQHVYFVLDEAQIALGHKSMRAPIAQGRDDGLHFIFAHQNLSDLSADGPDMTDAVTNNCAVSIVLGARDDRARERLEKQAGKRIERRRGGSITETDGPDGRRLGTGDTWQEYEVPRLGADELNELNYDPNLAVITASPASGFTMFRGPQLVEIPFPMSKEDFDAINKWPWPEPVDGQTIRAVDFPKDAPPPAPASAEQTDSQPQQAPKGKKTKPLDPAEAAEVAEILGRVSRSGNPKTA
jgi:hypothetical protein